MTGVVTKVCAALSIVHGALAHRHVPALFPRIVAGW